MNWTQRIVLFVGNLIAYVFIVRPFISLEGLRAVTDLLVGVGVFLMGCALLRVAITTRG